MCGLDLVEGHVWTALGNRVDANELPRFLSVLARERMMSSF